MKRNFLFLSVMAIFCVTVIFASCTDDVENDSGESMDTSEFISEDTTTEEWTTTIEDSDVEDTDAEDTNEEDTNTEETFFGSIEFGIYGEAVLQQMSAEFGELCVIPPVTATADGELVPVSVTVLDSVLRNVEIINNKFRATDMNGYTMIFRSSVGSSDFTHTIEVSVSDTTPPEFAISEKKGTVYAIGCEVEIPDYRLIDASLDENAIADISVVSPNGGAVVVENGKFTLTECGEYVIRYTAEDTVGNVGEREFVVSCRNAPVFNDFEQIEDIESATHLMDVSLENELAFNGNALKLTFTDNGTWGMLKVPFLKTDGTPYTLEELGEFTKLQMYVYSSFENNVGLLGTVKKINVGVNVITFEMKEVLDQQPVGTLVQYDEQSGMFSVNVNTMTAGEYLVFDEFVGIYDLPEITLYMEGYDDFPGAFFGELRRYFTVPQIIARSNGDKMDVEVFVYNSNNEEIAVTENKFRATDTNGYKIIYRVSNGEITRDVSIPLKLSIGTSDVSSSSMLNSFVCEEDIYWMPDSIDREFVSGGLKLEMTEELSWTRICVPFKSNDGSFITWEELQSFDYIEIRFSASYSSGIGLANLAKPFSEGENVITFTRDELISAYETTVGTDNLQYQANGYGFYLNLQSANAGDSIVISSISGFIS